jgi:hypothetical protein
MCLKITRRKHATHYILKHMLLDGVVAMLLTQRIDKRNLGRMRPDLREQFQVDRIDSLSVLNYECVDRRDIGRRTGVSLRDGASWDEAKNGGEPIAYQHQMLPGLFECYTRLGSP